MEKSIMTSMLVILFLSITASVLGQFDSPNNLCGGWSHQIRGRFNLTFNDTSLQPMYSGSKQCVWTIAPSRQWTSFRVFIENWTLPLTSQGSTACSTASFSINSFKDRDSRSLNRYGPFCPDHRINTTVDGFMMLLILRVDMSSSLNGKGIVFSYEPDPSASTNHQYRITTMWNSFGRFSNEPINYFAGSFFGWQLATYAFTKGNFSDNLKLSVTFGSIGFDGPTCNNTDTTPACDDSAYLGIYEIQKDGRLQILETLRNTRGSKEPYQSNYGIFLLWVGANNTRGGGRFSLYYTWRRRRSYSMIN